MVAVPGLTVGHGDLIGLDLLAELKRRGVAVVRLEAKPLTPLWQVAALGQEVVEAGLQPCFIATQPEHLAVVPAGTLLEAANEPDIERFGWSVRSYIKFVDECIPVLREHQRRMYAGVVSNLNERGLRFLKRLPWERWPADVVGTSFHRYPESGGPLVAHPPSSCRAEEIDRLRAIVGSRPLACTEVGYNTIDFSEQEAADYLGWERKFFGSQGVELVCAYGINDATGPSAEDHYGFRRIDGTWKPQMKSFFQGT